MALTRPFIYHSLSITNLCSLGAVTFSLGTVESARIRRSDGTLTLARVRLRVGSIRSSSGISNFQIVLFVYRGCYPSLSRWSDYASKVLDLHQAYAMAQLCYLYTDFAAATEAR
jgi:hypothetical protein